MRTSNPTFSESAFKRLGAGQGSGVFPGMQGTAPGQPPGTFPSPSYTPTDAFTVEGAIYKTAMLLGILALTGLATALLLPPELYIVAIIGGVIATLPLVLLIAFKPHLAKSLGFVYAIAEGVLLGAVTVLFESMYPGIASQALVGTIVVTAVMLTLYRTGVIKVTQRFRMVVMAATGAIFITYLISFVAGFFGASFGFLHGNSMLSIGISIVIIGVAAMNLALDFDFIENAAAAGLPSKAEWYAAFGLMVTLVWIYLEILRLLAKLQSRD